MSDSDPFADRSSDCLYQVLDPSSFQCFEYPRCDWGSSCRGIHSFSHYPSSLEEIDEKPMRVKGEEIVDKPHSNTFANEGGGTAAEKLDDASSGAEKLDDSSGGAKKLDDACGGAENLIDAGCVGVKKSDENDGCSGAEKSDGSNGAEKSDGSGGAKKYDCDGYRRIGDKSVEDDDFYDENSIDTDGESGSESTAASCN